MPGLSVHVSRPDERTTSFINQLVSTHFCSRVFAQDATLWGPNAAEEASVRLGWTDFADTAHQLINNIHELREHFTTHSIDRMVLCGMGGSSLAPAVIAQWAGVQLTILDSTHPETVRRIVSDQLERTAVVISSKSGTTVETRSHLTAFETAFALAEISAQERIVIVTDPGSELDLYARSQGMRVFNADPNIGGRFSALSAFGLVPAGLAGANIRELVDDAEHMREELQHDSSANPAYVIAATIAAGLDRRYVLALDTAASADWGLGSWIEQLIAESTGKDGKGVLPISLPPGSYEHAHPLPQVTRVLLAGPEDQSTNHHEDFRVTGTLGAHLLTWELATAALGNLMGVDPFNQPDVESAKQAARQALSDATARGIDTQHTEKIHTAADIISFVERELTPDGYIALQVFLDKDEDTAGDLETLREALAQHFSTAVALGWGPSYLHSTGQLHKGGPAKGVYLQFVDPHMEHLPVGHTDTGFDDIIRSQSDGDNRVLTDRGRPVLHIAAHNLHQLVADVLQVS